MIAHYSDVAYAAQRYRDWIEHDLSVTRARWERGFTAAVAAAVCSARGHEERRRSAKACKACRAEVDAHLAVVNGERLPL